MRRTLLALATLAGSALATPALAVPPAFPLTLDGQYCDPSGFCGPLEVTFDGNGTFAATFTAFGLSMVDTGTWTLRRGRIVGTGTNGTTFRGRWTGTCLQGPASFQGLAVQFQVCP